MSPFIPFSLKGQHHSTVICPGLPPSQSKFSTNQLSYVPLRPLLPERSKPLNCHRSPLYTLLPQMSASLNCRMPASTPSQSKIKTTQLSYVPLYSFSLKGQHHSTVICPLYPLLNQRSESLICHMPPLPPSQSKVSNTQLSYVPPPPPSSSKVSISQLSYVPPLSPSPSKVSITQLSYAPSTPF